MQDGEVTQSQKVELKKPQGCHGVHIELCHHRAIAQSNRQIIADGLVGNHNACGVNRHVARHTLKRACRIHQSTHLLRTFIKLFEFGERQRALDGHIEFLRNGTGYHVNVGIGHAKGSSNVANGGSCRHGTKRDNLRDVIGSVFTGNVFNDLVAAVIAKIDVDIGHGYTFGVEKTLKKQIKANGIDIGDAECIRYQASRSRTTSGAYGDITAFCIVYVVLHNQKVIGKAHFRNHAKLVREARTVFFFGVFQEGDVSACDAFAKALFGQPTQIFFGRKCIGAREFGQILRIKIKLYRAHVGNFDGVLNCFGIGAEQQRHLCAVFYIKIVGCKCRRATCIHGGVGLHTHQNRLRIGILATQIVAVVGGNQRQIAFVCQFYKAREHGTLLGKTVILNFDIVMILAKNLGIFQGILACGGKIALGEKLGNATAKASGKRNKTVRILAQQFIVYTRAVVKALGKGARNKLDQVAISLHIFAKENQVLGIPLPCVEFCETRIGSNVNLTTNDGFDARFFAGAVKIDNAIHNTVVGNGNRILSAFFDAFGQILYATRTVKQAIFGMQMQMYKILHGLLLSRLFFGFIQQLLQSVGKPGFGYGWVMQVLELIQGCIGVAVTQKRCIAKRLGQRIKLAACH